MEGFIVAKEENNVDIERGSLLSFVYGKSKRCHLHKHEYFEIFLIIKGSITHLINGEKQTLTEGALALIRPGDIHTQICKDAETHFANLSFTKKIANEVFAFLFESEHKDRFLKSKLPPIVFLNADGKERLLNRLNELNALKREDVSGAKILLKSILAEVLPLFITTLHEPFENDVPRWLKEVAKKMTLPENFTLGVDKMIELSKKSREHLSRSVKKYFNVTVSEYINDLKINYASNLLISTNIPIIDICFNCGFQNESHFYKLFKSKTNLTPKQFRKEFALSINI